MQTVCDRVGKLREREGIVGKRSIRATYHRTCTFFTVQDLQITCNRTENAHRCITGESKPKVSVF